MIQVGAATKKDFDAYKDKVKRSSDEILRHFLKLDIEPGMNVIVMSEEVSKGFESVKSALKVKSDKALKHLLITRDKYQ